MKTALSTLRVARPKTLREALGLLSDAVPGGRLTPLAGGTDLFVYLNAGTQPGTGYLDLSRLPELKGVKVVAGGSLRLGALTTFREIGAHARIASGWPSLAAAARVVGAAQIQNRGTIGGNIANASPAGDSLPVLLAHDAVVRVASVRGERSIGFGSLYTGYRRLALAPDELITAVEIPAPPEGAAMFFRKVGTRAAQSISKVVFAGLVHVDRGVPDVVRLAYGSVAATPVRAARAEAALLGAKPSAATFAAASEALAQDFTPIDDIRSEADYRMAVARNVLAQFLRGAHAGWRRA